jgi:hypothetical protein
MITQREDSNAGGHWCGPTRRTHGRARRHVQDQAPSTSAGLFDFWKTMMPAGRSTLAKIIFSLTISDKYASNS